MRTAEGVAGNRFSPSIIQDIYRKILHYSRHLLQFPDVMCFEFCVLSRETAGHLNPHHLLHFLVMNPKSVSLVQWTVFNRAFVIRPKL